MSKPVASEIWLRRHIIAFVTINAVLFLLDYLLPGNWWSFWLLYGWGLILAVHFFIVRSINVDEDWVEERAADVKMRSYDLGHISDINERIEGGDKSVLPPSDRPDSRSKLH